MHYEASHHSGKLKRNSLWESSGNDPKAYISESSQPRSKRAVVFIPPPLVNSQALPASRGWAKYVLASQEQPINKEMLGVHQHSSQKLEGGLGRAPVVSATAAYPESLCGHVSIINVEGSIC